MTVVPDGSLTDLTKRGFVVIRGFLPAEVVQAAQADYKARPVDGSNKNYGISMASGEANALLRPLVDTVLRSVRAQTDLKPDLADGAAYFATGRGINFAWHQDHESFFVIQNHYDYLNFYIPIIKPRVDKSNLCVIPFDVLERESPDTYRRVLRGGASRFVPMGTRTLVYFDDVGRVSLMGRSIEEFAATPLLDAGDLLLIRGDMLHRTQDSETERVAMSFRASMSGAMVERARLVNGGLRKAHMMAKNYQSYRRMFAAFDAAGVDRMTSAELVKAAAAVPEPPDDRRFIYELLNEKRRAGVLTRFVVSSLKEKIADRAYILYDSHRRRKAVRAAARAAALALGLIVGSGVAGGFVPTLAAAQTFTASTGMLHYAVRADRADAFERVVRRIVSGLGQVQSRQDSEPGVPVRVLRGGIDGEQYVLYVLVADPVVPGVDYSLASLAERSVAAADLDDVRRQIAVALEGAKIAATGLQQVAVASPLDRLRERIELELTAAPATAGSSQADRAVLDALRAPAWAADKLDYAITRRSGSGWQITWNLELRNASLVKPLNAGVVVELLDASGAVVGASGRTFVAVDPQQSQALTGLVDLSAQAATRVTTARLKVDPQ